MQLREGTRGDAVAIAALSVQVFLDTYAPGGVSPDLAREAFREYSPEAFTHRLAEPQRRFVLAMRDEGILGFAELLVSPCAAPAGDVAGAELVRLYVQPRAQKGGLGRTLIEAAERLASRAALSAIWLTVWDGNARAMAFYRRMGYADVGAATYSFEGHTYGNRVYARRLLPA